MTTPSLAQRLSKRLREGHGVSTEEFAELKATLDVAQVDRIKAKCQWEHVTWLGVLEDWPELFEPEGAQP